MLVAKIVVTNVKDYGIVSRLAEYSSTDSVEVDIYDRCHLTVPSCLFVQCLNMLYARNQTFEITEYYDASDED